MSLSTIYTHPPLVCRHPAHLYPPPPHPPPTPLDWNCIRRTTLATAAATFLAQIPACILDHTQKLRAQSTPPSLLHVMPMACLKRIPTKALTVTLFELGTQIITRDRRCAALSRLEHLSVAVSAGCLAVLSTFPLHSLYYSFRKGIGCKQVFRSFTQQPSLMFAGVGPALISTPPAVIIDYLIYRHLRCQIDGTSGESSPHFLPTTMLVVGAATTANLLGGAAVEPLKALSRRVAVQSVKSVSCEPMMNMARNMYQQGIGEFWRGYPIRFLRYTVSAVVSKTAVRRFRPRVNEESGSGKLSVANTSTTGAFVAPLRYRPMVPFRTGML